ncbi:hypothetical protein Tco_1430587 [Tanacetum coccineum]
MLDASSTFVYRPVSTPSGSGTSKNEEIMKNNGASTSKCNTNYNGASTSSKKGPGNSDDINFVSLRNSFAALNKHDKSDSDVDDVYDETTQFMASSHPKDTSVESTKGVSGSKSLFRVACENLKKVLNANPPAPMMLAYFKESNKFYEIYVKCEYNRRNNHSSISIEKHPLEVLTSRNEVEHNSVNDESSTLYLLIMCHHRHIALQIHILESTFKDCPNPDENKNAVE